MPMQMPTPTSRLGLSEIPRSHAIDEHRQRSLPVAIAKRKYGSIASANLDGELVLADLLASVVEPCDLSTGD